MRTWLVWESEYPDEGSAEFDAYTAKGACRAYRRRTKERGGPCGMTPLSVAVATPEILAMRAKEES